MEFKEQDKIAEKERLELMRVAFKAGKELRIPIPVALFVWKLLDVTEIWASKKPEFLVGVKGKIESFHKSLAAARKKEAEIVDSPGDFSATVRYTESQTKTVPNTEDDSDIMQAFLLSVMPDDPIDHNI